MSKKSKKKVNIKKRKKNKKKNKKVYLTKKYISNLNRKNAQLKEKKRKNKFIFFIVFVILFLLCLIVFINLDKDDIKDSNVIKKVVETFDERPGLYKECLGSPITEEDTSEEIVNNLNNLNDYVSSHKMSLAYKDLGLGFSYEYNINQKYYAASTIKMLDALYIYTKADNGEINLDDTVTYYKSYRRTFSTGMNKHKYGDEVSLRDLVSYAILYSDNTAHEMLIYYIGINNLKEYGKSLGANSIYLTNGEHFGNINIHDALIYVDTLNSYFNSGTDNALELKNVFINADEDYLSIIDKDIKSAHKYGHYSNYYNLLGIVYGDHPYEIVFLSSGNYSGKIASEVNMLIYNLNESYYSNREKVCHNKIYGEV